MEDIALYNENSLKALVKVIRLSQGRFRLILARCNYGALRDRMVRQLRELSPIEIQEIVLLESVKSLYTTIKFELGDEVPQALMVFGLESAKELKTVLKSSNYIREEFSKDFPFPLVLWVNDEVLKKLLRIAPDLESWATSVEFKLTTDELLDFLRQKVDQLFTDDSTINLEDYSEIEAACTDLQKRGQELEVDLEASLEFVRGLDDFANDQIDAALEHYQKSLAFWQQGNHLERQGIVLLDIARCYYRKAERYRAESLHCWEQARDYLQQCLDVFEQAQRPDLVAKHISKLGKVLRCLQAWEQLQALAEKALTMHQTYKDSRQLVRDYGFLAEIALEQSRWNEANQLARQALQTLTKIPDVQPYEWGLYQFLLARAQEHLGQCQEAIANLGQARQESNPKYDTQLYIDILGKLRSLYFQQGRYLEAFRIKQEQLQIEHQYGFRAFIGAGYLHPKRYSINPALAQVEKPDSIAQEIAVSSREQDVKRLIQKLSGTEYKLIVIHGQSGVGKSSILQGGLIPALHQQAIGERDTLPILLRVYPKWVEALGKCLVETFETVRGNKLPIPVDSTEAILEQLRKNGDRNLLTILIFDQFEEFFFVYTERRQRQPFYEFLRVCLDIPFVKIVFSLREDYLHYLLECERLFDLAIINNNILDKNIRYYLGNFSPEDAKIVVRSLTERSQFPLEPALVDELVQDLAGEIGEVRPIELQIVGAQLQTEKITTLEQYHQCGTKEKLVERFLEEVIKDCGTPNEWAARLALYFLTNENGTRPLKTRAELTAELAAEADKLDLVLEIFVKSGLVVLLPQYPSEFYQLVHDYLVSLIRQDKEQALTREKEEHKLTKARLNLVLEQQLRDARKFGFVVSTLAFGLLVSAMISGVFGIMADNGRTVGKINGLSADSERFFSIGRNVDALLSSLEAGEYLQQAQKKFWSRVDASSENQTLLALQQAVYEFKERKHFEGHTDSVTSVSFNPDDKTIASASVDTTIKLWSIDGGEPRTLKGHIESVNSVSFSPDGNMLASASDDKTINLWSIDGIKLKTLKEHSDKVNSVSFSPDGKIIASASDDQTIKLWSIDGRELRTLKGHGGWISSVSFSPDGKMLASASWDKTIKLWSIDGRELKTLRANDIVSCISFSPNSERLVSATLDGTITLWSLDGQLPETSLQALGKKVKSVSFSSNGKMIAAASADGTIKLWRPDDTDTPFKTWKGHEGEVNSVSFSRNSEMLVSAGSDNKIKLWRNLNSSKPEPLKVKDDDSTVSSLSFSKDGKMVSASCEGTIALWNHEGLLIETFPKPISKLYREFKAVSLSSNAEMLAFASDDNSPNQVKLWSFKSRTIKELNGHSDKVNSVSFSPDDKMIASASDDKTIKLWSRDGMLLKSLNTHNEEVTSVSFSPDSQMIASGSSKGTLILEKPDGTLVRELKDPTIKKAHTTQINSLSFSPNSQMIVSGSDDRTVKLWHLNNGKLKKLEGHSERVTSVSFSPNNKMIVSPNHKMIASADWYGTIKLWNFDGSELKTLEKHGNNVNLVSFSPDGKTLASAGENGEIFLWNLDLDELMKQGCDWVRDYLKNNPNAKICQG